MASETPLTVLVTGATDGLGKGIALALARGGHHVLVHGRDPARIEHTLSELCAAAPAATVRSYCADFAALADVRALAREVSEREARLDVQLSQQRSLRVCVEPETSFLE